MRKFKMFMFLLLTSTLLVCGCGNKDEESQTEAVQPEVEETVEAEETAEPENVTLDEAGTYTGEYDEIIITAADTILEDTIAEKIIIANEVGDGDVTLKNVQVKTLEVYGGGKESVHLYDSVIEEILSDRAEGIVRIVVESTTDVGSFDSTNTIIYIRKDAKVPSIEVGENTTVIIEEGASVEELIVNDESAEIKVAGTVGTLTLNEEGAKVDVEEGGKVEETVKAENEEKSAETEATQPTTQPTAPQEETKKPETPAPTNPTPSDDDDDEKPAKHEHEYELDSKRSATCTANGWKTYKCSCGVAYTEVLKAKGHSIVDLAAVAATCEEKGLTAGKKCSVCNVVTVEQKEVDALGHTVVVDTAKEPTCTETGLTEGSHCSTCNKVFVEQTVTLAKGHTEEIVTGKAATCTETGLTAGKKCSVCTAVLTAQTEIAALGHTEEILAYVAPTCTATGLTEGKKCSVCPTVLTAQTEIAALNHPEKEVIPAVGATCTETGLEAGEKCKVCGAITIAQTGIDAVGHNYAMAKDVNGHWKECQRTDCDSIIEYAPHTYSTNVCTEEASCTVTGCGYTKEKGTHTWGAWRETSDGTKHEHTCLNTSCNTTETKDHNYNQWSVTSDGTKHQRTCSDCSKVETADHTERLIPAVAVGCESVGYTEGKECSDCNKILEEPQPISAPGHDYETCVGKKDDDYHTMKCSCGATKDFEHTYSKENSTLVKAATCTSAGEQILKCTLCDATKKDTIPVESTAHKYSDNWVYKDTAYHERVCEYNGEHKESEKHNYDENNECTSCPHFVPGTMEELKKAFSDALQGGSSEGVITITITKNFDLENNWTTPTDGNYSGVNQVVIEGNQKKITGLNQPLMSRTFGGSGYIEFHNLTIADSTIETAGTSGLGLGAFINAADASGQTKFINCHLNNVKITNTDSSGRVGGFIGYSSGQGLEFTDCSVVNCKLNAYKDAGGFVGFTQAVTTVTNPTIQGTEITSTNNGEYRIGLIAGTAQSGGKMEITNITTDNKNKLTQTNATTSKISDYFGRNYTTVTVDGVVQ